MSRRPSTMNEHNHAAASLCKNQSASSHCPARPQTVIKALCVNTWSGSGLETRGHKHSKKNRLCEAALTRAHDTVIIREGPGMKSHLLFESNGEFLPNSSPRSCGHHFLTLHPERHVFERPARKPLCPLEAKEQFVSRRL